MLTKAKVLNALLEFNSQAAAGKFLGVSQMTISRAKRKFGIEHDGKFLANADPAKIKKQADKLKEYYANGTMVAHWKGKKQSKKIIAHRISFIIGKPAWNSGTKKMKVAICETCSKSFEHIARRKRRFCSRTCAAPHLSKIAITDRSHTRGKGGRYRGSWMRSSWELAFAKMLTKMKIRWSHEPKRFTLKDGTNYTPDFLLIDFNILIEIKGHWYEKAKKKFLKFLKENPKLKIAVIEEEIWKHPPNDFANFLSTKIVCCKSMQRIFKTN